MFQQKIQTMLHRDVDGLEVDSSIGGGSGSAAAAHHNTAIAFGLGTRARGNSADSLATPSGMAAGGANAYSSRQAHLYPPSSDKQVERDSPTVQQMKTRRGTNYTIAAKPNPMLHSKSARRLTVQPNQQQSVAAAVPKPNFPSQARPTLSSIPRALSQEDKDGSGAAALATADDLSIAPLTRASSEPVSFSELASPSNNSNLDSTISTPSRTADPALFSPSLNNSDTSSNGASALMKPRPQIRSWKTTKESKQDAINNLSFLASRYSHGASQLTAELQQHTQQLRKNRESISLSSTSQEEEAEAKQSDKADNVSSSNASNSSSAQPSSSPPSKLTSIDRLEASWKRNTEKLSTFSHKFRDLVSDTLHFKSGKPGASALHTLEEERKEHEDEGPQGSPSSTSNAASDAVGSSPSASQSTASRRGSTSGNRRPSTSKPAPSPSPTRAPPSLAKEASDSLLPPASADLARDSESEFDDDEPDLASRHIVRQASLVDTLVDTFTESLRAGAKAAAGKDSEASSSSSSSAVSSPPAAAASSASSASAISSAASSALPAAPPPFLRMFTSPQSSQHRASVSGVSPAVTSIPSASASSTPHPPLPRRVSDVDHMISPARPTARAATDNLSISTHQIKADNEIHSANALFSTSGPVALTRERSVSSAAAFTSPFSEAMRQQSQSQLHLDLQQAGFDNNGPSSQASSSDYLSFKARLEVLEEQHRLRRSEYDSRLLRLETELQNMKQVQRSNLKTIYDALASANLNNPPRRRGGPGEVGIRAYFMNWLFILITWFGLGVASVTQSCLSIYPILASYITPPSCCRRAVKRINDLALKTHPSASAAASSLATPDPSAASSLPQQTSNQVANGMQDIDPITSPHSPSSDSLFPPSSNLPLSPDPGLLPPMHHTLMDAHAYPSRSKSYGSNGTAASNGSNGMPRRRSSRNSSATGPSLNADLLEHEPADQLSSSGDPVVGLAPVPPISIASASGPTFDLSAALHAAGVDDSDSDSVDSELSSRRSGRASGIESHQLAAMSHDSPRRPLPDSGPTSSSLRSAPGAGSSRSHPAAPPVSAMSALKLASARLKAQQQRRNGKQ